MSASDWRSRAKVVTDAGEGTAAGAAGGDWRSRAKVVAPDAPPAPAEPGKLEALARGGAQGATMGFADEAAGAGGYLGALWSKYGPEALGGAPAKYAKEIDPSEAYKQDRDLYRTKDKAAEAAHPNYYGGAELTGGLATSMVAPGSAVIQGGVNALGHSNAKTLGGVALDTAGGAALGKLAEVGGNALANRLQGGKLAQWLAGKSAGAEADQLAERSAAIAKDVASKKGALGQQAADIIRSRQVTKQAAEELAASHPELAAKLQAAANDPAALERLRAAAENYLPRLTEGLEGFEGRAADLAGAQARDAGAEAADKLAHPVRDQIVPRLKHIAQTTLPPIIGEGVGHALGLPPMAGGALGGVVGLTMGAPGRTMANMVKSPAVRKMAADAGTGVLNELGYAARGLVSPTVIGATDDPDRLARLRDLIRGGGV